MKIAIVLKTFPPEVIGGMETQTKKMATELYKDHHEVTIFTKSFGCHDDSDVPYEVVRIQNWKLNSFLSDLTFLAFAFIALLRRRKEFDVLQCMMLYPVGFLGYAVSKITGLPYFAWIRGGDYYLMNDIWWKRWMMRLVLEDTLVLAQSQEIRKDILKDFENIDAEIDVLGNAVSIPAETTSGSSILYVGRLVPKKGLEYLIEAMAELEAPLTVVGEGSERDKLEKLAAELGANVTFVGEVAPDEVDKYYRSAGIFVLPSVEGEGMPNVVLEAMSWGLPVVATNSGGLPTMIDDGRTGYVVPMRNSDALEDRIRTLLDDDEKRETMGDAARMYVRDNHSWEWLVNELEMTYARVVE